MRITESKKPFVILLCILAIGVSGVSIVRHLIGPRTVYDPRADQCLGETIAHECGTLLNGHGEVVVLCEVGGKFKNRVSEARMEGFKRGLGKFAGIKIAAVEAPSESERMAPGFMEGVSEKFFLQAAAAHPSANLIVSFLGVPVFAQTGEPIDVTKLPKVVALNLSPVGRWKELVEQDVVSAVVVPRYDQKRSDLPKKGDCKTMFESRYWVVNKANFKQMEDKLKQQYPMM